MEIIEDFSGSTNDPSIIIKGKRTKRRQRPLSPVGKPGVVAAVTSSSSSGGGEDGDVLGYVYSLIPTSTTTCTSDISTTTSTDQEEEEDNDQDIANCLILLAQGKSSGGARKQVDQIKMEKFSSRRFNEMVTSTTGGKVGFFVYECKTCNRTFPSFQALGGHRASHKKPKVAMEEKKTVILIPPPPPTTTTTNIDRHHHEEEEVYEGAGREDEQSQINRLSPPLSVQSTNKCLERNSNNNKGKIHECSMCGAEFSSGQALGGHMRRHRNPMTTKVSMNVETSPSSTTHDRDDDDDESSHVVKKPRNIFPLDLNFPAPVEDEHHRELKFQQHHLVFTAPALVDCHY